MNEAAEQLREYTPSEYQAICKLTYGVPILRADDDFRWLYDAKIEYSWNYSEKIAFMDMLPVTRIMTTKQMKEYLDAVHVHFSGLGCQLTDPDDGGATK